MFPQASTGLAVEVGDTQTAFPDLDRTRLAGLARRILQAEGIDRAQVSIAIVDDSTIHEVNRRHLDHDCPTDVISFLLSEPGDDTLSGELVVSAETAVRMARIDGVEPWTELVLYVIHGLLHLCGLDDLTEPGAAAMRGREGELLEAEGLSHPFSPSGPDTEVGAIAPDREHAPWRS
jgi:probable rRNA maturation factor